MNEVVREQFMKGRSRCLDGDRSLRRVFWKGAVGERLVNVCERSCL